MIDVIDLHMLNHPCEAVMNPTWSWCMVFFICCWIPWPKFCWEFLCLYSSKILPGSFLFWWYLCLVLLLGWWREHIMSLKCSLFFSLLGNFKEDTYNFLFVCLVEFTCEAIRSWTFICRECFYYVFDFISNDWCAHLIYFFLIQFWQVISCPFLLGCQIWWHTIFHSIFCYSCSICCDILFHFLFCLLGFFLYSSWWVWPEVCQFLFTFSKNQLLVLFILSIIFWITILLISSLIFMISFLMLTLSFVCTSFSNSFRWWVKLSIWGFSSFFREACIAMNFLLSTAFAASHRFWVVMSTLSFVLRFLFYFSY